MFLFGIGRGIAMLAAQYYGKSDLETIEKVEGIGLKYALPVAGLGALACLSIYINPAAVTVCSSGRTAAGFFMLKKHMFDFIDSAYFSAWSSGKQAIHWTLALCLHRKST